MKTLLSALLVGALSSALFAESAKVGNSLYLKPAFAPLLVAAAEVGSSAEPSGMGTFAQGYADGQMAAQSRSYMGSMGGRVVGGAGAGVLGTPRERSGLSSRRRVAYGVLTGVIYTGIGYWFTRGDKPDSGLFSGTGGSEYRAGFTDGYKEVSKKKKRMAELHGGLLGTAAFVAGYIAASR